MCESTCGIYHPSWGTSRVDGDGAILERRVKVLEPQPRRRAVRVQRGGEYARDWVGAAARGVRSGRRPPAWHVPLKLPHLLHAARSTRRSKEVAKKYEYMSACTEKFIDPYQSASGVAFTGERDDAGVVEPVEQQQRPLLENQQRGVEELGELGEAK